MQVDQCKNPAQERQAIGRLHRVGQTRPVTIHHLLMKGSVETRLRDLIRRWVHGPNANIHTHTHTYIYIYTHIHIRLRDLIRRSVGVGV